jgi:hypothetical protein
VAKRATSLPTSAERIHQSSRNGFDDDSTQHEDEMALLKAQQPLHATIDAESGASS